MNRPVVAEVIWGLDVGGAEVLLLERLRASDRTAANYVVVAARPELRAMAPQFDALGIPVIFPGAGPRRMLTQLKRIRPTVINVHSPLPALWLKAAHRIGYFGDPAPRLIETIHSESYGRPLFEHASARLNPTLDQVVAVSRLRLAVGWHATLPGSTSCVRGSTWGSLRDGPNPMPHRSGSDMALPMPK